MIKATELRIGNWVSCIPDEGVPRDEFQLYALNSRSNMADVDGILITRDWLEKFGFKTDDNCFYRKGGIDGWFLSNSGGVTISLGQKLARMKFVHQLQNLYFALTGEELTTKPKP